MLNLLVTLFRFFKKRFRNKQKIRIVQKGLTSSADTALLSEFEEHAYNTLSTKLASYVSEFAGPLSVQEVKLTTLDDLINEFFRPDFIKINVEGWEVEFITGANQQLNLISFEYNQLQFELKTCDIVRQLVHICLYLEFYFCTCDPIIALNCNEWMISDELIEIVQSGHCNFMEIFCRKSS